MSSTQYSSDDYSKNSIINLLFSRPGEPIFMPKIGDGKRVMFEVPDNYLNSKYRVIKKQLNKKWKTKDTVIIPIQNVTIPDLTNILKLPREETFAIFIEEHQKIASDLIKIFMDPKNPQDLISVAAYCHDRVNPHLFHYALSVALLHRKDTKDVILPSYFQTFPTKFVNSTQVVKAKQEATVVPKEVRESIVIPQNFTANEREIEQKVAYFREDIGINLHHWHWHLVYPQRAADRAIVDKDRRGELFYYMHQQIIARYNAERFCNDLPRAVSIKSIRDVIPEAYFSKLFQGVASRSWPPRFPNIACQDINRPESQLAIKLSDMDLWEKNLKEAISKRMAKDATGKDISLAGDNGIDILGNMVEASLLTVNRPVYGNYHNFGHVLIAFVHDPEGKWLESASIMGDTATAMRDPVFYKWHSKINDIFVSLKDLSTPYTKAALTVNGVTITDFNVATVGKPANELHTYWQRSSVDTSRGLDFTPLGPANVTFTHLQHEDFTFTIKVNNTLKKQVVGYARIFMAPKFKEGGKTMDYNEQRQFMIELDKFRVYLKAGANTITRKSVDSSVTIPFERSFRDLDLNRPTEGPALQAFNFCGCGWPHHMLIPKGTEAGAEYELFVMISDYEGDKIVQDVTGLCNDAESYCGIQDKKYPDKKSMGYPFDRKGEANVKTLADFLTPNMKVQKATIKFNNKIVPRTPETNVSVVPAAKTA